MLSIPPLPSLVQGPINRVPSALQGSSQVSDTSAEFARVLKIYKERELVFLLLQLRMGTPAHLVEVV